MTAKYLRVKSDFFRNPKSVGYMDRIGAVCERYLAETDCRCDTSWKNEAGECCNPMCAGPKG